MLEHRIPPPLVALACIGLMWLLMRVAPGTGPALPARGAVAFGLVLLGVGIATAGVREFRRAHTTLDPRAPGKASVLVASGIYRASRNPMYLGMAVALCGVAWFLGHPLALLGVAAFVAWITRFQILPEERALDARFGEAYARYRARVRRWL